MLIPDPRRTPLPNLISHNGIILYHWEFLRARLDEGEGWPWIAMEDAVFYCVKWLVLKLQCCVLALHCVTELLFAFIWD